MNNPLSRKLIPSIYPLTPKFAAIYAKKPAKSVSFFRDFAGSWRGNSAKSLPQRFLLPAFWEAHGVDINGRIIGEQS